MVKFISNGITRGSYITKCDEIIFTKSKVDFTIDSSVLRKLKSAANESEISSELFCLTAYIILLYKYSYEEDIVIESIIHSTDNENSILSYLKSRIIEDDTFLNMSLKVNNQLCSSGNEDNKSEYHNIVFENLSKGYSTRAESGRYGLWLSLNELPDSISGTIYYSSELFDKSEIVRFGKYYQNLLQHVVDNPQLKVYQIDILSAEDKKRLLVDFNDTQVDYPRHKTIAELFLDQVKQTPDNTAVVYQGQQLTYQELNKKANSLARTLQDHGIKENSIVGIMANRSLELIVGIIAILKAGGAYLPIDCEYPQDRINYMLHNSEAKLLLSDHDLTTEVDYDGTIINLKDQHNYHQNTTDLAFSSKPESLAYTIYTSGTTGRPKGVAVKQYSVVRLIKNTNYIDFNSQDKLLQTCAMTFDVATFEIWGALFNGIELHLTDKDVLLNAYKLGRYISEKSITVMWLTSPLFNYICDQDHTIFRGLRCLLIGGDVVSPKNVGLVLRSTPNLTVVNGYGPSENTTFSTCYTVKGEVDESKSIPIGKPIANSTAYILDKHNMLVPIGVYGELCVGGDGLAQGYLHNEELTAQKFVVNPFANGEQMYRTGDLVRWLPDGNIEFLGRVDHQLKIRGFRIEPAEIENQLLQNAEITQALVLAQQDASDSKYLCAYLVAERELTVPEIRKNLAESLPNYMIPTYFIQLAQMPLNVNGKTNRKALPQPAGEINTGIEYLAPRNEVEQKLVKIWSDELRVSKIGIDDDFFSLGGDSLRAINIAALTHKELKVDVSVSTIFTYSTIRELSHYLGKSQEKVYAVIEPESEKELYEVSSAQKRMYATNQLASQAINYNIPTVLILEGVVERSKVAECFQKLITRHESFRTSFEVVNNKIMQRIHPEFNFVMEYEDLSPSSEDIIEAEVLNFVRPFDLQQAPLIRAKLLKLHSEKHVLMIDMHHIIADGVSLSIIMKEFTELYQDRSLPELKIRYRDYASWENRLLSTEAMRRHEEYWTYQLNGEIPVLNLPTDYPRPGMQSFEGDTIALMLEKELTQKLKSIAKDNGATLYMVLFSAYNILLSKYTGQEDIIVGSAVSGRPHADLQQIVGMFVNTLPMRNYPKGNKKFKELLYEVKNSSLNGFENQHYPFNCLIENLDFQRDFSRSALVDAMFVLQNTAPRGIELNNISVREYRFKAKGSKCDLTLDSEEINERVKLSFEYCTRLFKPKTIEIMVKHFVNILNAIIENPDIKLCDIDMLSDSEKQRILIDFNNTKTQYPRDRTIIDLFEEQVERTPQKIAVVYENQKLTYLELNEKANQLARNLVSKGVKSDSIVGIMADRTLEMIIGIVAILKAGAAYLPIDADYPRDRINYMLKDSKASVLLSEGKFMEKLGFTETINLNDPKSYYDNKENLGSLSGPQNLSYIIYTSGTTGRPKGVAVIQQNVVRLVKNTNYIQFKSDDKILQTGSVTFDASTFEIWGSLLNGLELHLTTKDTILNADKLGEYLLANKITIMWLTSPLFNKICEEKPQIFKGLSYLLVGGDVVLPHKVNLVRSYAPQLTVVNGYGPTENTTFSVCYAVTKTCDEHKSLPIGKPIANSTAYVLDKYNNVAPIGVYGELCVGGDGLARGYLNNQELTDKKFVPNPHHSDGQLMYRTGDLVRWLPSGNIEFWGRIDHQVKIRGFRIELAEIENSLLKLNGLREAVVIARERNNAKYLCAYFVSEQRYSSKKVREELKQLLPDYMIPSYFMELEELPLNQNGKIDRKSLPLPTGDIETGVEYLAPRNKIEQKLVEIWCEVLEVNRISVNDDFFTLGGHSLKAIKMAAIVQRELKVQLTVGSIFKHSMLKKLAEYLRESQLGDYSEIVAVSDKEHYEVSPVQRRMFTLNQYAKDKINYNIPTVITLEGKLEKNKVADSFKRLVDRHEAFRTSFKMVGNEVMQRVHQDIEFELGYQELNSDAKALIDKEIKGFIRPFDLSVAPLLRAKLIKLSPEKHVLMFDMHHIISDGTSMGIIMEEFTSLYQGKDLPELRVQYKDYAIWQNQKLTSGALREPEEYWTSIFQDEVPILNLPTDYQRPSRQSFEGADLGFTLGQELTQELSSLCQAKGATMYMVLLSVYNILLAKYSGQEDVVVGSVSAGRTHADLYSMVGAFVNTLALRNRPSGNKTFNEFLEEVKHNALNSFEYQDYQFEMLIQKLGIKRDLSRNILFDTMFVLQNTDNKDLKLPDISIKKYQFATEVSKVDMLVEAFEMGEDIRFNVNYCTALFKKQTIEKMMSHFKNIIKIVVNHPEIRLREVEMLSEKELQQILVDFNDTQADYPHHKTICELFEEQVQRAPNQVALVHNAAKLTYQELNERANGLAAVLREKEVKSDSVVGIMAERSVEMIVGIIAILKAGGAYLPIDSDYPSERINYMLVNSKTNILLTQEKYINRAQFTGEIINLNDLELYRGNKENLAQINTPDNMAYVIYTSGTTGKPKGVAVKQRSVVRLIKNTDYIEIMQQDRLLQTCAMTFDVATFEIWGALFSGIELHLTNKDTLLNANRLGEYITANQITIMWLTSPLFNNICEQNPRIFKGLRCLLIGGDVVSPKNVGLVKKDAPELTVVNGYGPTENTTFSTCYVIQGEEFDATKPIPIGKPIANSTAYVFDKDNKLAPIGAPGELCVGGDGLAIGYLNNGELTSQKFVKNPYLLEELMYRTGDLVRWLPDGNIDFLGRVDHQVKIRGFRIELGEIENQLLEDSEITQAVVVAKEDSNNSKYLCAYLVANREIPIPELRNSLAQRIPDYMIPTYFIQLAEMPLTLNGKVNRKALPEPDGAINTGVTYLAPSNEVEQKLAKIWSRVLDVSRIGIDDDFFSLGGDSLKAINILAIIQRELQVEVSVSVMFTRSTIRELAEHIGKTQKQAYSLIEPVPERELYQVSSAQKRMFALNQFSKDKVNYNIPAVVILTGRLNEDKVANSFQRLVTRHEAFRTSFEMIDAEIKQRVHRDMEFTVDYTELNSGSAEIVSSEVKKFIKPFDLTKAPLLRAKLLKLEAEKHVLMVDMHHIISDGTSMGIIMDEFTKLYQDKNLPQLRVQYKDYAAWQKELLTSESMHKQEQYWINTFKGEIPVLNLPTDYPRPSIQSFEGANIGFTIDQDLTQRLRGVCQAQGATMYMLLLAAYNILLARYSGQEDIIVGSASAGRPHVDLQNIVGMFVNTLAMRNYPIGDKSFTEFLEEVKNNALSSYENQDYQFEMLVQKLALKRDSSRNTLFDTMFVLQNTENKELQLSNISIDPFQFTTEASKLDILLEGIEKDGEIHLNLDYCTKLFAEDTMKRMIGHFKNVLTEIAHNPHVLLAEIEMLSGAEKKQILGDFNDTKTLYPYHKTICESFEEQVASSPNKVAVVYEDQHLTFKELNERANQLGRTLRDKGLKPDSVVGIMVDRSLEMLVGIMGILKAGAAYMPISSEYPDDRIKYMLRDSKATVLLTQSHLLEKVSFNGEVIDLADKQQYHQDKSNLDIVNSPADLANVIYTSGSTGKPKGVMIQHGNVINLVTALSKNIYDHYEKHLNITLISPYYFDASVKQIFASLLRGNCLHIVPEEYRYMGEKLIEYYIDHNIDISDGTPSHFKLILSDNTERLKDIPVKHFIIGGEELPVKIVQEMLAFFEDDKPNITNIYGPTECCVDTTAYLVDYNELSKLPRIPIGGPLANYRVYVINPDLKLQPIGVAGELCIGGDGLARGYLNKPDMTEQKFIVNPFAPGERMYKTGDLVKWLPNGDIEFSGRIDYQIKIRGYRIEIGEIDSLIKKHHSVQDTVVLACEDDSGEKRLVAYVVAKPGGSESYSEAKLKGYLKNQLPKYMIPAVFMQIDTMPLNANGKVDRSALPEPVMQKGSAEDYIAPRNKAETEMAKIWAETLGIEKIGIDDDFFDIGGDSFKAIKLVRNISSSLGVMQLFKNSTIRELVAYLAKDVTAERTMLNELTKPVADKDRVVSLICFPFGGGSAISYQPLANALPKNYSLYSVELAGHDFSCPDEDLVSIEESTARCLTEIKAKIKGPIVLYGHCLGATMAASVAYKLEEAGIAVNGVFMGAMFPAPRISNWFFDVWEKIFPTQLTNRGNRDLLRAIGGLSSEISAEETDFILRNLKHDSHECIKWYTELYKDKQNPKFKAPITSVIGDGDRITEFYQERYYEWEHFSDDVDLRTIKNGGHFFFKNQANELAEILEEKISYWLGLSDIAKAEAAPSRDKNEKVVNIRSHRRKHVRPSMQLFLTVAIMQIVSEIGSFLAFTGCTLWILQQTGALSQFAIMLLFRILPQILFLPFAGVIVDRFSRRVIMIVGDVCSTVGSLGLMILLLNNSVEIWHIYAFVTVASVAACFRQPAYWAAITQITPKMYLAQANSVANFSIAIGGIIASLGSGFLMATIGLRGIIMIDFISFSLAIVVLLFVRFPNTMFNRSEEPILKEILGGCRFIIKRHSMIAMVVFFVIMNFLFSMFEVTITPVLQSLVSLRMFGVIRAFMGIGSLFGAIIMLVTGGLRKRAKGMVGFVLPIAVAMIIGSLRPSPVFIAIAFFVAFASLNVLDIHWRSLIQVKVGLELQGRVFAVNRMMVSIFIPLSLLTAGILSDRVFLNLLNTGALSSPLANFILAPGVGRAMRLTLFVAGLALLLWSVIGMKYKPLFEMDNILEDASVGDIVIKDKDKLQKMIDRKHQVGMDD